MPPIGITIQDIKNYAIWGTGLVLIGAVGFVHGRLSAHEVSIEVNKSRIENMTGDIKEFKDLFRELLREAKNQ